VFVPGDQQASFAFGVERGGLDGLGNSPLCVITAGRHGSPQVTELLVLVTLLNRSLFEMELLLGCPSG